MSYETWKQDYAKRMAGQVAEFGRDMQHAYCAGRHEASRELTSRFEWFSGPEGMNAWLELDADRVNEYLRDGYRVRKVVVTELSDKKKPGVVE